MSRHTFNSDTSKALIVQIHQLIRDAGGATKNDIYLVTRLSERRIGQYLRHMTEQMDAIHKLADNVGGRDVWVDGPLPKPDLSDFDEDEVDRSPIRKTIRATWEPVLVKHEPLHAAFFGIQQ